MSQQPAVMVAFLFWEECSQVFLSCDGLLGSDPARFLSSSRTLPAFHQGVGDRQKWRARVLHQTWWRWLAHRRLKAPSRALRRWRVSGNGVVAAARRAEPADACRRTAFSTAYQR